MGILALHSKKVRRDLVGIAYYGMYALQHRGQEGAGYTICDSITNGEVRIKTVKNVGLVSDVFKIEDFQKYEGNILIAHTRYGSKNTISIRNCQPIGGESAMGYISLVHNGDLLNKEELKQELLNNGSLFQTGIDTEIILKFLSIYGKFGYKEAVLKTIEKLKGCFALGIIINDKLIAVRDPEGLRPLCLGKIVEDDMYVLASESCALDAIGAEFVRDIEAGEMVVIDDNGVESIKYKPSTKKASSFEYIYFAHLTSVIDGQGVSEARVAMGRQLAKETQYEADIVMPIPNSGTLSAQGYAEESGIPYREGLVRNPKVLRTFIEPNQISREEAVCKKFSIVPDVVQGKRIVLIDDSIVRGTTSRHIVSMLRQAGAKEIYLCLTSEPIRYPCYFGIDTSDSEELLAHRYSIEEISQYIGVDRLYYLSHEGLMQSMKQLEVPHLCVACFTGEYPSPVGDEYTKGGTYVC